MIKRNLLIGLGGGIVISLLGWLSLNLALFAVECGEKRNEFFIALGNIILFPIIITDYLLKKFEVSISDGIEVALGITVQLLWYVMLTFIVSSTIINKRRNYE